MSERSITRKNFVSESKWQKRRQDTTRMHCFVRKPARQEHSERKGVHLYIITSASPRLSFNFYAGQSCTRRLPMPMGSRKPGHVYGWESLNIGPSLQKFTNFLLKANNIIGGNHRIVLSCCQDLAYGEFLPS